MDLWQEIEEKNKMLDKAIKDLAQNGYDLATKERNYKVAVNKKALELRADDMPVTLIQQVIYGYEEISKLRFICCNSWKLYVIRQEGSVFFAKDIY